MENQEYNIFLAKTFEGYNIPFEKKDGLYQKDNYYKKLYNDLTKLLKNQNIYKYKKIYFSYHDYDVVIEYYNPKTFKDETISFPTLHKDSSQIYKSIIEFFQKEFPDFETKIPDNYCLYKAILPKDEPYFAPYYEEIEIYLPNYIAYDDSIEMIYKCNKLKTHIFEEDFLSSFEKIDDSHLKEEEKMKYFYNNYYILIKS